MRKAAVVAVLLLSVAGVALAQSVALVSGRQWFPDGVFLGPRVANPASAARNALTATYESALLSYDFGAVEPGYCADSPNVTVGGAALGDGCVLGMDQDLTTTNPRAQFLCRVTAANTGVVRLCSHAGDGGTSNPSDAGYTLRTFR